MTVNEIASKLCKMEGKKHQATIGDVRELLKILVSWEAAAIIKSVKFEKVKRSDSPFFALKKAVNQKVEKHLDMELKALSAQLFDQQKAKKKKATKRR